MNRQERQGRQETRFPFLKSATLGLEILALAMGSAHAGNPHFEGRETWSQVLKEGGELSAKGAALLREGLLKNPHNLEARMKVAGWGSQNWRKDPLAKKAFEEEVLWLVENEPRHHLHDSLGFAYLFYFIFEEKKELTLRPKPIWMRHIQKHREDSDLMAHGLWYIWQEDRKLAEAWLERGEKLEPKNGYWPFHLGWLFGEMSREKRGEEAGYTLAAKAKESYLRALKAAASLGGPEWEMIIGLNAAEAARNARQKTEARDLTLRVLKIDLPEAHERREPLLLLATLFLARLDAEDGRLDEAENNLRKAAILRGEGYVPTYGEGLRALGLLVQAGKTSAVLEFLRAQADRVVPAERQKIIKWIERVKKGENPFRPAELEMEDNGWGVWLNSGSW